MKEATVESKLNPKELNKILPSYLIDELEDSKNDNDENLQIKSNELNKVRIIIYLILFRI